MMWIIKIWIEGEGVKKSVDVLCQVERLDEKDEKDKRRRRIEKGRRIKEGEGLRRRRR